MTWKDRLILLFVSVLGALALSRGEPVGAVWLLIATFCTYLIGYRYYSYFIAYRVFILIFGISNQLPQRR